VTSLVLAAGALYGLGVRTPAGPRSLRHFEPDRLADLEVSMWQAYYRKEKARLFGLLVVMLREQRRCTWARAAREGFHLARAAATFGDARGDYERVLPDLQKAYAMAREWTSSGFDPARVARAELAWWVARRQPGRDDPPSVGALIAEEYALLYEVPVDRVAEAARLRAEAAALRDAGGAEADWAAVSRLLRESYRSLHAAVAG
jgi:hypothetical protein